MGNVQEVIGKLQHKLIKSQKATFQDISVKFLLILLGGTPGPFGEGGGGFTLLVQINSKDTTSIKSENEVY